MAIDSSWIFPLNMVIFYGYVKSPEGNTTKKERVKITQGVAGSHSVSLLHLEDWCLRLGHPMSSSFNIGKAASFPLRDMRSDSQFKARVMFQACVRPHVRTRSFNGIHSGLSHHIMICTFQSFSFSYMFLFWVDDIFSFVFQQTQALLPGQILE